MSNSNLLFIVLTETANYYLMWSLWWDLIPFGLAAVTDLDFPHDQGTFYF